MWSFTQEYAMTELAHSRVGLLVGLAVVGLALASAGTALGVADPVTDSERAGTFVVSGENLTVSSDSDRTVVTDLTGVETVEVSRVGSSRFAVRTEQATPLSEADRRLATRIARSNETVVRALSRMENPALTVEPIRKLTVEESVQFTAEPVDGLNVTSADAETQVYRMRNETVGNESGTVVVERDPDYADDEATVEVRTGDDELRYSVHVDVVNETVVGITDWEDI